MKSSNRAYLIDDEESIRQDNCQKYGLAPLGVSSKVLLNSSDFDRLTNTIRQRVPAVIWIVMKNVKDFGKASKLRARRFYELFNLQRSRGGHVVLEAKDQSIVWEQDAMEILMAEQQKQFAENIKCPRIFSCKVRSCQLGCIHPVSNEPVGYAIKYLLTFHILALSTCKCQRHHSQKE